ncbi:hypothetical protein F3Y22_tig00111983pilonHSYRG00083 [Hibiscus syriacus]|uniref:Pectinesterase inhibitor domain-containing protein n=1 Tax=Hibiscus syriacus TaxID=106335 RepID=A0A6A2YD28_HIBSY|nr:uncharacterized protein LOC120173642 [Hibiscus syriacus]KAE8671257.1 hypothetical protein F3Y22_tig00111983pilonHSYRG00083 [Hibiscus syriacus]
MEIKHFVLIISIFYILQGSSSSRPHTPTSNNSNKPAAPNVGSSIPAAPDESTTTPDSPDAGEESPDAGEESPESPYASNDNSPLEPASGPSAQFSFASMPASNPPGLDKICQATKLPVDCTKFISPFVNSSVKIEPLSIAKVGIRVSTDMSKQAIDTATRFMDDPKSSASLKEAMSTCLENYQSIPDDNDLALQALDKRNANEAAIKLSSSLASVDTCLDGNHQMHITSPMRDMEEELQRLLHITLTIVSDMVKF